MNQPEGLKLIHELSFPDPTLNPEENNEPTKIRIYRLDGMAQCDILPTRRYFGVSLKWGVLPPGCFCFNI